MIHSDRIFHITPVHNPRDLADNLANRTWTLCTGYQIKHYLFLNDSYGQNSAQEYAVINIKSDFQIESITFSWMDVDTAEDIINRVLNGEYDQNLCAHVILKLDYLKNHRCHLCR